MEDRLDCALVRAINIVKDKKTKQILQAVRELGDELAYMDWSDWINYSDSDEFGERIKQLFS